MHRDAANIAGVGIITSLGLSSAALAQLGASEPAPASIEKRPEIKLIRFDEDWSPLHDPRLRTDRLDMLKYIPLRSSNEQSYLSLGGEFRGVYERMQNNNWSATPYATNGFGLQRDQHFYVKADYGVFFAGRFLHESGRAHNLNYTAIWVGYKF